MPEPSSAAADAIRAAGVVGAGGAGFPTHVKASARAEVVIANGAECEPLLQKDREILKAFPDEVLAGLELMMRATGAGRGILAVKAKHKDLAAMYGGRLKGNRSIELLQLGDFYPAGDEFSLVYDATGKVIPPGGIPIQIGVVVNNVETLYNAARAAAGPVIEKFLTVAGAVASPCTLKVPVGASFADLVAMAGGALAEPFAALDGGAMMGRVVTDMSEPVTKTSGGLIILPADHALVRRKAAPRAVFSRIGRSVCDQCSFCTQFCPRYLLGYAVEPHKVMRTLAFSDSGRRVHSDWALLCCECSLCSLYACPEDLDPRNVCVAAKGDLRGKGTEWKNSVLNTGKPASPLAMREFRKVPIERLVRRLGLEPYKADAPLTDKAWPGRRVRIPLKQHVGAPAEPAVEAGDRVAAGQVIGEAPKGLGARVHASISGTVAEVGQAVTIEG